jgi:retinol dehydrogenase-12
MIRIIILLHHYTFNLIHHILPAQVDALYSLSYTIFIISPREFFMTDIHNSSRVAAVTGATGAIGKAIARQLADFGFKVYLIARTESRALEVAENIRSLSGNPDVNHFLVDLSRKDSIIKLSQKWHGPLHVLVNNAATTPPQRLITPEGIELQFATNVLGYFWMTTYFSEVLKKSSPSRVVNVASYWAGNLDLDDLEFTKRAYHNHDAYRQSKQANRMLSPFFAKMYQNEGIIVNACHPGDVNSPLSNNLGFGGSQSPDEGAKTPVWLASSPEVKDITGKYFEDCKEVHCRFSDDLDQAGELYEICKTY